MNLFRSEEHIGRQPGVSFAVGKLSALAHAWWADRLDPAWRPHTAQHNQGILRELGLTGPFWELPTI